MEISGLAGPTLGQMRLYQNYCLGKEDSSKQE